MPILAHQRACQASPLLSQLLIKKNPLMATSCTGMLPLTSQDCSSPCHLALVSQPGSYSSADSSLNPAAIESGWLFSQPGSWDACSPIASQLIWLQFLSPSLTGSNPDWLADGEDGPGASGQSSRLDSTRSQGGDSKSCRGDWRTLSYRGGCSLQAEGLSVSPVSHTPAVPCLSPKAEICSKQYF